MIRTLSHPVQVIDTGVEVGLPDFQSPPANLLVTMIVERGAPENSVLDGRFDPGLVSFYLDQVMVPALDDFA